MEEADLNPTTVTIALIGPAGVGKSALAVQLLQYRFMEEYDSTIEDFYKKQLTVDGEKVMLEISDTSGMEDFRALVVHNIRFKNGFLIVFDVCDRASFEGVDAYRDSIVKLRDNELVPMILVGNKTDRHRIVTYEEAAFMAASWGVPYMEASAKTRVGVSEVFSALVRLVRQGTVNKPVVPPKHLDSRRRFASLMTALARRKYNVAHYRSYSTKNPVKMALDNKSPMPDPLLTTQTVDGTKYLLSLKDEFSFWSDDSHFRIAAYHKHNKVLLFDTLKNSLYTWKRHEKNKEIPVLVCSVLTEEDDTESSTFVSTEDGMELAKKVGGEYLELKESELAPALRAWVHQIDGRLFQRVEEKLLQAQVAKVEPEPILNFQAVAPLKNLSPVLNSPQLADIVFTFAEFDHAAASAASSSNSGPFDPKNFDVRLSPAILSLLTLPNSPLNPGGAWCGKQEVRLDDVKRSVFFQLLKHLYVGGFLVDFDAVDKEAAQQDNDIANSKESYEKSDEEKQPAVPMASPLDSMYVFGEELFDALKKYRVDAIASELENFSRSESIYLSIRRSCEAILSLMQEVVTTVTESPDSKLFQALEMIESRFPEFAVLAGKMFILIISDYNKLGNIHKRIAVTQFRLHLVEFASLLQRGLGRIFAMYKECSTQANVHDRVLVFLKRVISRVAVPLEQLKTKYDEVKTERAAAGKGKVLSKKKRKEWRELIGLYTKIKASETKLTKDSLDEKLPKIILEYEEKLDKFDRVMKDSLTNQKRRVDIDETLGEIASAMSGDKFLWPLVKGLKKYRKQAEFALALISNPALRQLARECIAAFEKWVPTTSNSSSALPKKDTWVDQMEVFDKSDPDQVWSDVTFTFEDDPRPIHAHRVILASHAESFQRMFLGGFKESKQKIVAVSQDSYSTFKTLLKFIYMNGNLSLQQELKQLNASPDDQLASAVNLLVLSLHHQVEPLRQQCERFLCSLVPDIDVNDIFEVLTIADTYQAKELRSVCIDQIVRFHNRIKSFDPLRKDLAEEIQKTLPTFDKDYCKITTMFFSDQPHRATEIIEKLLSANFNESQLLKTPHQKFGLNTYTKYLVTKGARAAQFELCLFDQEPEKFPALADLLRASVPAAQQESQIAFIVAYEVMTPEFVFRALDQIHQSWLRRTEGKRVPMILLLGNRDFDIDNVAREQAANLSREYRTMFVEYLSASGARVFEAALKKLVALRLLQDEALTVGEVTDPVLTS